MRDSTFVTPTADIVTVNAQNVNVTNNLRANHYDLQSVAQLGGSFYVSPTVKFPNSSTSLTVAKSDTTLTLTITDSSITSTTMAGIVWTANSRVKVSGTINGVVTGTMDGTITSINASSHVLTLSVSGENSGNVVAGTYSASQISDLSVMVYQRKDGSNDYRVGIWMNCYDMSNSSATIRIYGGTTALPNVMIGNLTNAGLGTVNNLTPTGWGLFAQNAFLHGSIVAKDGRIGGFTLSENWMYSSSNAPAANNLFIMPAGTSAQYTVGGQASTGWVFTSGTTFGVTKAGGVYATSGQIGGFSIGTTKLSNGTLGSDSSLFMGTTNLGSAKIADNTTDAWRLTVGSHFGVTNTGAVYATSGKIGGWTLADTSFTSGTWGENNSVMLCIGTSGSKSIGGSDSISGWVISAGSTFGVTKAGDLYASQATVSGKITATELYLGLTRGALTASVGNLKSSTGVLYGITSSSGNYLYYDGDIISINTKNFKIDGDGNVSMFGVINASGGTVGGLTVSADSLYMVDTGMSSNGSKYAFWAGETNGENGAVNSNAAFKVGHNGGLIASNATISGKITATGGTVGGWNISNDSIYMGDTGISSNGSKWAFWAGETNGQNGAVNSDAEFRVGHDGQLVTNNIVATGGTVGGFQIDGSGIFGDKVIVYSVTDGAGIIVRDSGGSTATSIEDGYVSVKSDDIWRATIGIDGISTSLDVTASNSYGEAILRAGYDVGMRSCNQYNNEVGFMLNNNNNAGIYDYSHARWALSYNTESKAMTSASSITVSSDERIKTIHKQLNDDHKKLFMALKPIEFSFIDSPEERHFGLGAQTTERSMNELGFGSEYSLINHISCYGEDAYGRDEAYYMNYTEALMLAVPVVQSHEEEIAELKAKINELEIKLSQLTQ